MAYQTFNMDHQWLPFTPNRSFIKDPRIFVAADGMHFTTHDGRQVLDGISSLWCVAAGHNRRPINEAIKKAAAGELKGVLGTTSHPNVSIDFNHYPHSSTFAFDQTKVQNGTLVRVLSWYDNEWGFSNRMADTAVAMGKLL